MADNLKDCCSSIEDTLMHIKGVQSDIMELNFQSMSILNEVVFDLNIELDENAFVALQHQDILTQQLNATNELIDMIVKHIQTSKDEDLVKNINSALEVARSKKEAFSGNAFGLKHKDVVEFLTS